MKIENKSPENNYIVYNSSRFGIRKSESYMEKTAACINFHDCMGKSFVDPYHINPVCLDMKKIGISLKKTCGRRM